VKSREASIASSRKSLLQTQANLDAAKLNVKYCTILSPVDGVIVDRKVDIGQTVQSSVNVATFYTIATDLTNLKLTAMVDEAEIGKVRRGMPVSFTVESYGPQAFTGTVDAVRLGATTQNNVVTYPVWINVPNNDLKLRPSMTATARIIISTAEGALRIPNGALRFKPNAEIYTSLGLTPPTAGQGGRAAGNGGPGAGGGRDQGGRGASGNAPADAATGQPTGAPGAAPAPGASAPAAPAAADAAKAPAMGGQPSRGDQQAQSMSGRGGQSGQGGRGGQGYTGQGGQQGQSGRTPRGFGQGGTTMTQQGMADFLARGGGGRGSSQGGRGGSPGGGRGGRNQPANASGDTTPLNERLTATGAKAEKIDDLFQEPPHATNRGQVWTWDDAKKELKMTSVTYGVSDGSFSELVSGDLQQGQQLVTSVIVPQTAKPGQPNNANPFMGQQPGRGGMPGMSPSYGGPSGGGGGGGSRGGGGGRGGN
jgi:uncharacterized membrane protein YgcG